jgi:hypothetical protein
MIGMKTHVITALLVLLLLLLMLMLLLLLLLEFTNVIRCCFVL